MKRVILLLVFISLGYSQTGVLDLQKESAKVREEILKKQLEQFNEKTLASWDLDTYYLYFGNGNAWKLDERYSVTARNSMGMVTNSLYEKWNTTSNAWEPNSRQTLSYNASGQKISEIKEQWDNTSNKWVNNTKDLYTYDNNGNMTEYLQQSWDNNNTWINYYRELLTYDANGNLTEKIVQYWYNNAWSNNYRYLYTYDANGKK